MSSSRDAILVFCAVTSTFFAARACYLLYDIRHAIVTLVNIANARNR